MDKWLLHDMPQSRNDEICMMYYGDGRLLESFGMGLLWSLCCLFLWKGIILRDGWMVRLLESRQCGESVWNIIN